MDTGPQRTQKIVQKPAEKTLSSLPPPQLPVVQKRFQKRHERTPLGTPLPGLSRIQIDGKEYDLSDIRATGDLLLEVTFENRKSSLKLVSEHDSPARVGPIIKHAKSPNSRLLYRVRLETLKKASKYFELLLGSKNFAEGSGIANAFTALKVRGISPSEAEPQDLPRISIIDDDDTTRIAGREAIFADLLRVLHGADINTRLTIPYLTTLAVMADRFDCAHMVARYVKGTKRFPWPQTFGQMNIATEEVLRQKILIAWLLDDQVRLVSATRELILRGSLRWTNIEEEPNNDQQATWWDLQDGIEAELQHRRACILSTLSSLQSHFLALYTSRERQCKQFYDSSAACDSYQLGEMIKFFTHKRLLTLTSALSPYDDYPEFYGGDIENLITILRQCPSYQIDKNHSHCGLRTRIIPALDYIQTMLASNIGIDRRGWKNDRPGTSWSTVGSGSAFRFTRSVANDQRLKIEGYLAAEKYAKALFTAGQWDWTPEE